MDCEEFVGRLPDACAGDDGSVEFARHANRCPRCASSLARARLLGSVLSDMPRETPPPGVLDAVRAAAARRSPLLAFARVAAALLLAAGAGLALHFSSNGEPDCPLLDVEVVVEAGEAGSDEEIVREAMYGPDVPILTAVGGRSGGPHGR